VHWGTSRRRGWGGRRGQQVGPVVSVGDPLQSKAASSATDALLAGDIEGVNHVRPVSRRRSEQAQAPGDVRLLLLARARSGHQQQEWLRDGGVFAEHRPVIGRQTLEDRRVGTGRSQQTPQALAVVDLADDAFELHSEGAAKCDSQKRRQQPRGLLFHGPEMQVHIMQHGGSHE